MGENKGKGTKGRSYDELSGVGTSSAGITGTVGNLNNGMRDGGIGKPSASDSGNRAGNMQSAELDDDVTPALGSSSRSGAASRGAAGNRQSAQSQQSQQSGAQQRGSPRSDAQQSSSGLQGSQQSGSQQSQSGQSGSQQSDTLQPQRSLDQDVMGKEQ